MLKTLVVWNSNAGSVDAAADIRSTLERHKNTTIVQPVDSKDMERLLKHHCENGTKLVVAAGGDGTINSVINGLNDTWGVTLGVLPLGTANDWCSSLGIPDDLDEAMEVLMRGETRILDIAEVVTVGRTTRFANIATGGNSYRVTESLTDEMKQSWGPLCYMRGAISILSDLDSFETEIRFDDGPPQAFSVWNIIIANGKTSGGRIEVAPKAILDDGLLDVVIIQSGTVIDLADMTVRYVFGDYIDSDQVVYRQARKITIKSTPPLLFSIDGDLVEEQPVTFRAIPRCQLVIVGPGFGK